MLTQKLEARQTQGLAMTLQVRQAIKILQMSHLELREYLSTELLSNPLLEMENGMQEGALSASPITLTKTSESGDGLSEPVAGEVSSAPQIKDSGWHNAPTGSGKAPWSDPIDGASLIQAEVTLIEALSDQLATTPLCEQDRLIGHYLIAMVDEAGYLAGSLDQVATDLGILPDRVESVLKVLQTFEPCGILARTLEECLTLQLIEKGIYNEKYALLVENLPILARQNFDELRKICQVSGETLKDMVAHLRLLNPKPGHAFGRLVIQSVIADVFVHPKADGDWLVELNTDVLPRLLVNKRYYATVGKNAHKQEGQAFLNQCHTSASWLVKSLDQRAQTILNVAREIVRQQDGFFAHGVMALRPLNLRAVGEVLGLHESTISRAVSHKYIATPRGIFEMKYFFSSAVPVKNGEETVSSETIRQRIKLLIDHEKDTVLSDDDLVKHLKESGIDIARRTVAKYREFLKIPSSVVRRRSQKLYGAGDSP